MLTARAAKELGRALRFMRHTQNLTLRDVAKRAELSAQYVQNIERGERTNASEEAFEKLARGYGVPFEPVADQVVKARIMSALETRGLDPVSQAFVWEGADQRLQKLGMDVDGGLAKLTMELMRHPTVRREVEAAGVPSGPGNVEVD